MEFKLTEEQRLMKDTARALVAREIEPVLAAHDRERPLPKAALLRIFHVLRPLGVIAPRIPESVGGSGMSYLNYGLVMEELPTPVSLAVMAHEVTATRIHLGADEEQRRRLLPRLLDGSRIACSGIGQPNVGSDPAPSRPGHGPTANSS